MLFSYYFSVFVFMFLELNLKQIYKKLRNVVFLKEFFS